MPDFIVIEHFIEHLASKVHNLTADQMRLAVTNTLPTVATDEGFLPGTSHPPPAAANGYTTGGGNVTTTSAVQVAGVLPFVLVDPVVTAAGGDLGPFQYGILYNDTALNDEIIGFVDLGDPITLSDGGSYTFDLSAVDGILKLSVV